MYKEAEDYSSSVDEETSIGTNSKKSKNATKCVQRNAEISEKLSVGRQNKSIKSNSTLEETKERNITPNLEKISTEPKSANLSSKQTPGSINQPRLAPLEDISEKNVVVQNRKASQDNDHLSIMCHLFPRLSETNLQFHDIYWNFCSDTGRPILRKRKVKVTKILRSFFLKLDAIGNTKREDPQNYILEIFLVDQRPGAHQQIVSNLYSLNLMLQTGATSRINILNRTPTNIPNNSILIRSNYAQNEVQLRLIIKQASEKIGQLDLPILLDGKMANLPKTQTQKFGEILFGFQIDQVPTNLVPISDCLPDVIICDESWIGMLACFRQLTCEALAHREILPQSTWVNDVVVATFPKLIINKTIAQIFLNILAKNKILQKAESTRNSDAFRTLYMNYMLPLFNEKETNNEEQLLKNIHEIEKNRGNPISWLSSDSAEKKFSPLNILDYSLYLNGKHAID